MMVRESEQRRGGECFAPRSDNCAEPGERSNAGDAEECGRKPQGPGAIAEDSCAPMRKHRVKTVLILVVEGADDVRKGPAHVGKVRVDLVEPQTVTQIIQPNNQRCDDNDNEARSEAFRRQVRIGRGEVQKRTAYAPGRYRRWRGRRSLVPVRARLFC